MLKINTLEFIRRSNLIHNYKYQYDNTIYSGMNNKVYITCKIHGDFLQKPKHHIIGSGCKECANLFKTNNTNDFIINAKLKHGDLYDYSCVDYKIAICKIDIKCQKHGIFKQLPRKHIEGHGCNKCKVEKLTLSLDTFSERANLIHNNFYDYQYVNLPKIKGKVKIICPLHGPFLQRKQLHLNGCGCNKCWQLRNIGTGWTKDEYCKNREVSNLYIIYIKEENFIKVGITVDINNRYNCNYDIPYEFDILYYSENSCECIYDAEKSIKQVEKNVIHQLY